MIKTTLQHLTNNGIMVVQFGELDFQESPNRTSRYVVTARKALQELGVKDPNNHLLVAAQLSKVGRPLDDRGEAHPVHAGRDRPVPRRDSRKLPDQHPIAAPGHNVGTSIVSRLASGTQRPGRRRSSTTRRRTSPRSPTTRRTSGTSPASRDVIKNITHPLTTNDPEDAIGERVLLLLLGIAVLYAAVFLLAPFFAVRKKWRALPAKGRRPCTSPRSGSVSCSSRSR